MSNNLRKLEKQLRSYAKRVKSVTYTSAFLISFLLTGMISLSATTQTDKAISQTKNDIVDSTTQVRQAFINAKRDNDRLIKNSNLELIKLMEQGDQVVKSPWSSWQFGVNTFIGSNKGRYSGRGDKKEDRIYKRLNTKEKYLQNFSKTMYKSGNTLLTLENAFEPEREVSVSATLRTVKIEKKEPSFAPTKPSGGLPPFEPLMVVAPNINPKSVNISEIPQAPPTNVAYQDIPKWVWGYNLNNTLSNNALIAQSELLKGTFNNYFSGLGNLQYNFSGASEKISDAPSAGATVLPNSDAGESHLTKAFYTLSGKAEVEIPNTVTVNVVGNNEEFGDLNSIYYMGNPRESGNLESKLIHKANTNIYGNKIAVVNIDNVSSTGGITFINSGKITGYAEEGEFTDTTGTKLKGNIPGNHVFGAYSYGTSPNDKIENGIDGSVIFYAPKSVGWAYSSANTQGIIRSSINNGQMQLFGKNSLGIATDNDTSTTQMAYADIQLNTPIEIYGDESVGASFLTEANDSSDKFLNSKFNIQIGGKALTKQDTNYGDSKGDVTKVQNSVGLNFDFTNLNNGFVDQNINNYIVKLEENTSNSTAIRLGQAKLIFNDSATSGIIVNGEDNVGYLSEGNNYNSLIYNNMNNNFKITGKNSILFAAKNGGTLKVNESLPLTKENVSGKGFTLAYTEGNDSLITLNKGVTGEVKGDDAVLYYAKGESKITVIESPIVQPSIVKENGISIIKNSDLGTTKIKLSGKNTVGFYAIGGSKIEAENSFVKLDKGLVAAYSDDSTSNINLKNSIIDYNGSGYSVYSKNNGKINLEGSTLILRGKSVGLQGSSLGDVITDSNSKIVVMSNDSIPFEFKNKGVVNLTSIDTDLGITASGIKVINGKDETKTYTEYKKAFIDGVSSYNINTNIDKSLAANILNESTDSFKFVKRYLTQRAVLNLEQNKNVIAHLKTSDLLLIGQNSVVGLDMSSSSSANSNLETQINLNSGTIVSAARTDKGIGATGLFINYGKVSTDTTSKIEVEKLAMPNNNAVGIYAVNGSEVINKGTVNVGGNDSIGLLGLSYRVDTVTGEVKENEFGGKIGEGTINIENEGTVSLNGTSAYGIYVKNNNIIETKLTSKGSNKGSGILNLSGNKSIGMFGDKATLINETNAKINMIGQEQVGIYASNESSIINKGEINLAMSTVAIPSVGIYTNDLRTDITNEGKIIGKDNTYGIFGTKVTHNSTGEIKVGNEGVAIYSTGGDINLNQGSKVVVGNNGVGVFTTGIKNRNITSDTNMKIGDSSFGYVLKNKGITNLTTNGTVILGNASKFIFSDNKDISVENNVDLTATGDNTYGIYSAGKIVNKANIDFEKGRGSVGIYSINGGQAINDIGGIIKVSGTNLEAKPVAEYGMGMATSNGTIINNGKIIVAKDEGIGMFASGNKSKAVNRGEIELVAKNTKGIYITDGATAENYGTIRTAPTIAKDGIMGVVVSGNSIFKNYGNVIIEGENNTGVFFNKSDKSLSELSATDTTTGSIGVITVSNGATKTEIKRQSATEKTVGNIEIQTKPTYLETKVVIKNTDGTIKKEIPITRMDLLTQGATKLVETVDNNSKKIEKIVDNVNSNSKIINELGMYIDTSGVNHTRPYEGLENITNLEKVKLLFGTEITKYTNATTIEIGEHILEPYNKVINNVLLANSKVKFVPGSASLTWFASGQQNETDEFEKVIMVKIPYTNFALKNDKNNYNFLDGLEQRYGVEGLNSRERIIFNKLNDLNKGEAQVLTQAVDEMKGHQYANTQMRIKNTGDQLSKEFDHLMTDWYNPSKQNNKIKVFGMKSDFNTDTAGIKDFESNSYGVAYVHEDETIKLGENSGWYAGAIYNRFRFKDIGKSKEDQNMLKLGVFKTRAYDNNGSLKWKSSLDGFVGMNDMERRYLVVDEIFGAKSRYYTYGIGLRNEVSKDYRLSEHVSLVPYGSLNVEYGRFTTIKEKKGEIRLEVKGNHYISVKPEVGAELKFNKKINSEFKLTLSAGLAYELELGKVYEANNKARVNYTNADWYNLANEKENRTGNLKGDLKFGLEKNRFGLTLNVGYDTKGNNLRGGLGVRVVY